MIRRLAYIACPTNMNLCQTKMSLINNYTNIYVFSQIQYIIPLKFSTYVKSRCAVEILLFLILRKYCQQQTLILFDIFKNDIHVRKTLKMGCELFCFFVLNFTLMFDPVQSPRDTKGRWLQSKRNGLWGYAGMITVDSVSQSSGPE